MQGTAHIGVFDLVHVFDGWCCWSPNEVDLMTSHSVTKYRQSLLGQWLSEFDLRAAHGTHVNKTER